MLLTRLQVENYRGIRSADVTFDETTALIGENETGKGTLFEILREILNPKDHYYDFTYSMDRFHLIDNIPVGDISIMLTFSEMVLNEWDSIAEPSFQELIGQSGEKQREVSLKIVSRAPEADFSGTEWQMFDPKGEPVDIRLNEKLIPWLRQYKRVIFIQAGLLTGMMSPDEIELHRVKDFDKLTGADGDIKDILYYSSKILTDTSTNHVGDIRKGFRAALAYIERFNTKSTIRRRSFGLRIGAVLGKGDHELEKDEDIQLNARKDISQQLGVLLLTSAWVKVSHEDGNDDVDPIAILEDPEAHLHPITLACTTELFALIRWQKLITTYSGGLISEMSLARVRRLTRKKGVITEHKVKKNALSLEDLRKVGYHLGARNSSAWFSRVWLLVEGESEYWIIPHIAQKLGYSFPIEGISCIEFAQSGLSPIIKLAEQLGIEWHVLIDGDAAGMNYLDNVKRFLKGKKVQNHVTVLPDKDIENHFWKNGYDYVYTEKARISSKIKHPKAGQVIKKAIRRHSKPYLSLSIVDAVMQEDSAGVPEVIENLLHTVTRLARNR